MSQKKAQDKDASKARIATGVDGFDPWESDRTREQLLERLAILANQWITVAWSTQGTDRGERERLMAQVLRALVDNANDATALAELATVALKHSDPVRITAEHQVMRLRQMLRDHVDMGATPADLARHFMRSLSLDKGGDLSARLVIDGVSVLRGFNCSEAEWNQNLGKVALAFEQRASKPGTRVSDSTTLARALIVDGLLALGYSKARKVFEAVDVRERRRGASRRDAARERARERAKRNSDT